MMEESPQREVDERRGSLVRAIEPSYTAEEAEEAYQRYLRLCQSVLVPYDERKVVNGVVVQESDYARIPQRRKVEGRWVTEYVDAPKKSAWRKLARFYGVTTKVLEERLEEHEDGAFTWHFKVRASVGEVSADGVGSCSSNEKGREKTKHEARATAHTRANNRAISDLIGFGQVSAEEIQPTELEAEVEYQVKETRETEAKEAEAEAEAEARPATERQRQALHRFGVKKLPTDLTLQEASDCMEKLVSLSEAGDSQGIKEFVRGLNKRWSEVRITRRFVENKLREALSRAGGSEKLDEIKVLDTPEAFIIEPKGEKTIPVDIWNKVDDKLKDLIPAPVKWQDSEEGYGYWAIPKPEPNNEGMGAAEPGGAERSPLQVVRDCLEPLVNPDDLDFEEDREEGALKVKPMRHLGDRWDEISEKLEYQFGGKWVKEGRQSRWEIPLPEEDE